MSRTAYYSSILLALLATFAAESVFGRFALEPREKERFALASRRVTSLPREFGPWKTEHEAKLSGGAVQMLQCAGYVNRTYVHQVTGERVSLAIIVGPSGPLVVHTPDICYSSRQYEITAVPTSQSIGGVDPDSSLNSQNLFHMSLRAKSVWGEKRQVYFGWSPLEGGWQAPPNPRLALVGQPYLYKLHLSAIDDGAPASSEGTSTCQRFLDVALPELNRWLFLSNGSTPVVPPMSPPPS
jgi:hypothetical protein